MSLAAGVLGMAGASALGDVSAQSLLYPFNSNNPAGWTQSMAPNDDGSTGLLPLGFDFCFYETDRNALYINNNGNVSFSNPFGAYTSTGFPSTQFDMIAPFWADVDTRNPNGADTNMVWHRTFDSNNDSVPDVFVVTWDSVGYYNAQNGVRNTFQVALAADENMWGLGLNAAFSYGRMDWTTGQASGGGPFGGTPATVGINQGNGVDFDQLGRFDHAGLDYNGFNTPSGVDVLEGHWYFFDACQGIVPSPGSVALLGMAGVLAGRRRR
jgi:uncharacterized protein (TIGR03382 family)